LGSLGAVIPIATTAPTLRGTLNSKPYPPAFDGAMMLCCVRRSPQPGQRNGAMRMGE
jgi:hypothetical protein